MTNNKLIDEIGDELKEIGQMGGDVDALKKNNGESELEEADDEEEVESPETEEDDSEEEEDDTSEAEEEEEEPDEKPEKPQKPEPKPKAPDNNPAKDRFKRSEGKRNKRLDTLESTVNQILTIVKSGKTGATEEAQDAIDTYAEKHKLDKTAIKELVGIIESRIKPAKKADTDAEEPEDDEVEETEDEPVEYNAAEEAQIFDEEWTGLEESLREKYPNATPKQILAAKRKMDEISHSSEAFAKAALAKIYQSNTKIFDNLLFSPKKKGGENGFLGNIDDAAEEKDFKFDSKNMSPKKAAELERMLDEAVSEEEDGGLKIMRDGEEVME